MKRSTLFGLATLLVICFTFLSSPLKACVDPEPAPTVHCEFDSNYTDIAIWVSNIHLFTGTSVQFCSCAITNYTNLFTNIQYISFVDSGTTNPIGFVPWTSDANATNAWENVLATGNWEGFIAQVASSGALPGVPVQLLIRAQLPAGYTFSILDSNLVATQLGTDEWDNGNQTLANSHQEITNFWASTSTTYQGISPSSSYFQDLDADITTGIERIKAAAPPVMLFPNPASDRITVMLGDALHRYHSITIMDLHGREIQSLAPVQFTNQKVEMDLARLNAGLYFVKVETDAGPVTRKLLLE